MSQTAVTPDLIWERITALQGQFFRTHLERWFTYRLDGDALFPSHSDLRIPRADFETALWLMPSPAPQKLAKHVTGYEFVWAVLNDERVSGGPW